MNYSNCDVRLSLSPARKSTPQPPARRVKADHPSTCPPAGAARRRRMPKGFAFAILAALGFFSHQSSSEAATASWSAPFGDVWMYSHAPDPGGRPTSPLFGNLGDATSDEKLGQMVTIFNTAGQIATGLGAANYQLNSVVLTLTVSDNVGGALYDGSYDSYRTYLAAADPNYLADSDTGRPIELYGAGFRNGFTAATFTENSAYSSAPSGSTDHGTRNVYPITYASGSAIDASNNVSGGFDVTPFAVGQATLTAGATVPVNTTFTFTLNLSDSNLVAYIQNALNAGRVDFVFTSLAAATQPGVEGLDAYLSFFNKENNVDGPAASLAINYLVVPEPGSLACLATASVFAFFRRRCAT